MMGNGWGMGWMWLFWPLIILLVVLLVVFLVRGNTNGPARGGSETAPPPGASTGWSRAQEILDERYARGELSDEEYQERRRRLRGESDR